jgi:hypothetical protein
MTDTNTSGAEAPGADPARAVPPHRDAAIERFTSALKSHRDWTDAKIKEAEAKDAKIAAMEIENAGLKSQLASLESDFAGRLNAAASYFEQITPAAAPAQAEGA